MATGTTVTIENVTISSTISPTHRVCPGEMITFNCVTRGSLITAWLSEEYIGAGGARVEFAAVDIGESRQINQNTMAMLISAEIVNGTRILTSQLTIMAVSEYQNPSVTCLHVGLLTNATVSFQLLGMFIKFLGLVSFA